MKSIHTLTYSLIAASLFLTGCESNNSETTGAEYVALYEQANAVGKDTEALSIFRKLQKLVTLRRNLASVMPICTNVTVWTIQN